MSTASLQRLFPRAVVPLLAACLFTIVVGLKWAVFDRFGSPMPDWDQWDAEGAHLLAPWFERDAFWQHFFHPHNEHRLAMTKAQNLTLTVLNGQWDARLEAVTNALLHAALASALWVAVVRWLRSPAPHASTSVSEKNAERWPALLSAALFVLAIVLFGLPVAWQNVLGGFHSQQYWLISLSFAAILLWPFARPWSRRWWLGAFAGSCALLTMASGFIAAAVVILVVGWRLWRRELTAKETGPTFTWCALLIAIGLLTRTEFAGHAELKAKSAHDFIFYLLHSLQWPLRGDYDWPEILSWLPGREPLGWLLTHGNDAAGVLLWLPWALVTRRVIRSGPAATSRGALTLAALGGWVLVQLLATAYARGAGADYPASRYMDTLTFGAMINAIALAWLARERLGRRARLGLGALAAVWLGALTLGVVALLKDNLGWEMPRAKAYYAQAEMHLLGFLVTNDIHQLQFPDIPYPDAVSLASHLRHQSLRALMPAVVRPSLNAKPDPAHARGFGFVENRASPLEIPRAPRAGLAPGTPPLYARPTWGSFGPRGAAEEGTWVSEPLRARLGGWLKFEVAGDVGARGDQSVGISLNDAATGALLAVVEPDKVPGNTWRAAYVRAPEQPFTIAAVDDSSRHWLAFSAPVEVAPLSYFAWRVSKHGLLIAEIAAGVACVLLALGWSGLTSSRFGPSPSQPTNQRLGVKPLHLEPS